MKTWRFYASIGVVGLFFLIIISRLFSLQVLKHSSYRAQAETQQQAFETIYPVRGEIFMKDRYADSKSGSSFFPVAINKDFWKIYAVPKEIEKKQETVEALSPFLTIGKGILLERINKEDDPYEPLQNKIDDEIQQKIKALDLKGIYSETENRIYFPADEFACHILGFVRQNEGKITQGQYGVGEYYDKELAGKTGLYQISRDSRGQLIPVSKKVFQKPEDGADIILTIDPNIQFFIEQKLKLTIEKLHSPKGSIIIMEAKTGAIKAMASWPGFDPNNYGEVKDVNIFTNSIVRDLFEPGSVFKPITMAAALDINAITPNTTYEDKSYVDINGTIVKNFTNVPQGVQTMTQVLEKSLNTGAIFVMQKMGKETFKEYIEKFGFGDKTGIDLPGEVSGNLANLKTKRDLEYSTAAFGQGIAVTPIELITAFGAIANDGVLLRPYIVEKIKYVDGTEEVNQKKEIRRVISSETASKLTAMLVSVIKNSYDRKAQVTGYQIAGKTGTAQIPDLINGGYKEQTIHTFENFFPAYNPKWVMLIKIDEPQGIKFAADSITPVGKEITQYILNYYEIPPTQ